MHATRANSHQCTHAHRQAHMRTQPPSMHAHRHTCAHTHTGGAADEIKTHEIRHRNQSVWTTESRYFRRPSPHS